MSIDPFADWRSLRCLGLGLIFIHDGAKRRNCAPDAIDFNGVAVNEND